MDIGACDGYPSVQAAAGFGVYWLKGDVIVGGTTVEDVRAAGDRGIGAVNRGQADQARVRLTNALTRSANSPSSSPNGSA